MKKVSRIFVSALVLLSAGCGVSFADGKLVAGTTSYLAEYNRGNLRRKPLEQLTAQDRTNLNNLIAKGE